MTFKALRGSPISRRTGRAGKTINTPISGPRPSTRRNAARRSFPAATQAINDLPVAAIDTGLGAEGARAAVDEDARVGKPNPGGASNWYWTGRGSGNTADGENPARWRGHLDKDAGATKPDRSLVARHHDAVPYVEMPHFMATSRQGRLSACALEFAILTAARTGEVIGASWSEIDFPAKLWTIPAERIKAGREHRVPLSDRAIEPSSASARWRYVFPGARAGKPLSNMATLEPMRGMRGRARPSMASDRPSATGRPSRPRIQ